VPSCWFHVLASLTSGPIWIRDLVDPRAEQAYLKKKKEMSVPARNKILVVLPAASQYIKVKNKNTKY
jgi:hypothetical protein